jgi:hypothetical protein
MLFNVIREPSRYVVTGIHKQNLIGIWIRKEVRIPVLKQLNTKLRNRMIYCGSGSHFGKFSVSVPVPGSRPYLAIFQQQKKLYKILPFQCQKQRSFPENWPLIMLDPDLNPVPELFSVLVPLRQKFSLTRLRLHTTD